MPGSIPTLGEEMLPVSKNIGDADAIRKAIISNAYTRLQGTPFLALAEVLDDTTAIVIAKHWHNDPYDGGGWTFPRAGQDKTVSDLLKNLLNEGFDFLYGIVCVGEGGWFVNAYRGVCLASGLH